MGLVRRMFVGLVRRACESESEVRRGPSRLAYLASEAQAARVTKRGRFAQATLLMLERLRFEQKRTPEHSPASVAEERLPSTPHPHRPLLYLLRRRCSLAVQELHQAESLRRRLRLLRRVWAAFHEWYEDE